MASHPLLNTLPMGSLCTGMHWCSVYRVPYHLLFSAWQEFFKEQCPLAPPGLLLLQGDSGVPALCEIVGVQVERYGGRVLHTVEDREATTNNKKLFIVVELKGGRIGFPAKALKAPTPYISQSEARGGRG
jgi:hypothetical protein